MELDGGGFPEGRGAKDPPPSSAASETGDTPRAGKEPRQTALAFAPPTVEAMRACASSQEQDAGVGVKKGGGNKARATPY